MEKKVDIDKRSHALDILEQLNNFRKNNKHCDFIIKAGKEERPVHRYVISACSEYFDAMLTHDTKESRDGVVEIKDVDSECVMKCVDFMYTGEAMVSDEKQGDLMHVAHMMRLHRLYNGVAIFLGKKLDCQSFFTTREIANTYDCKKLTEVCNEFALENFRELAQIEDFKTLEDDYLGFLLASKDLKVSEWVKCKAVMVWVNHDSSRASALFSMIKCIDFVKISLSYRRFLIDNEPYLATSIECMKFVMKSILDGENVKAKDVFLEGNPGIIVFDSSNSKLKHLDMESKTWSERQMTQSLGNQTYSAVLLNGYIYTFCTYGATYRIEYENESATWEQMANFSGHYGVTIVMNGLIYMMSHSMPSTRVERYDPTSNQWSFTPDRMHNVCHSALTVAEGKLYAICGFSNNNKESVSLVERFDPATSSWSNVVNLNQSRHYASAVTLDNTIYVLGGRYQVNHAYQNVRRSNRYQYVCRNVSSMEIFNQSTNSWELLDMPDLDRSGFNTIAFDRLLFLVGGTSSDARTIYQFDPHTKKLTKTLNYDFDIVGYASVAETS